MTSDTIRNILMHNTKKGVYKIKDRSLTLTIENLGYEITKCTLVAVGHNKLRLSAKFTIGNNTDRMRAGQVLVDNMRDEINAYCIVLNRVLNDLKDNTSIARKAVRIKKALKCLDKEDLATFPIFDSHCFKLRIVKDEGGAVFYINNMAHRLASDLNGVSFVVKYATHNYIKKAQGFFNDIEADLKGIRRDI